MAETIRLSQQDKDRLVRLKRATGIKHWNVLCRWAITLGVLERIGTSHPADRSDEPAALEIDLGLIGGEHLPLYASLHSFMVLVAPSSAQWKASIRAGLPLLERARCLRELLQMADSDRP